MPPKIPDLWPEDLSSDVVTPIAIMRTQASILEQRTKGVLEVDINSFEREDKIVHNFDLIAPSLDRFRERILTVSHDLIQVYPANLQAIVFKKTNTSGQPESFDSRASSQEEFIEKLKQVLRSDPVRASVESLIARSNDNNPPPHKKQT